MTTDYTGAPLAAGDVVEGWCDGIRYKGTVIWIERKSVATSAGSGSAYRWITVRSDDGDLHETFSDAVRVIQAGARRSG